MNNNIFEIGTFNILAKGLSIGEFFSQGGDNVSIDWNLRGHRVANVLSEMMKTCDIVVTQENDNFFSLLNQIRIKTSLNIRGIYCIKSDRIDGKINLTNARSLNTLNMLNKYVNPKINSVKDLNHDVHYKLLNDINENIFEYPTFNQECGIYGEEFAKVYGKNGNNVYISDDGIGIYYNANKMTLNSTFNDNILDVPITFNMDGWIKISFTKNNKLINVYGAHLPSGERQEDEVKRLPILKNILIQASLEPNSFIVMDSNNSVNYESKYHLPLNTSILINQYGFHDSVSKIGYECFKMRHNMGSQIAKHCLLMFDTIDKILYNSAEIILKQYICDEFGFQKYDLNDYSTIYDIRNNDEKRSEFENKCRNSIKTDDSEIMFTNSQIFQRLYPNKNACSDHPPISSKFHI